MDRSLLLYLAITAALTTPFFLSIPTEPSLGITFVLILLCSFAPAMAAILTLRFGENRWEAQSFWQRLGLCRVEPFWYAIALLLPAGVWLIALAHFVFGEGFHATTPARLLILPLILIAAYGSEAGLRGFVLPRLLTFTDPIPASLLLGLLWSVLYAPFFWREPPTMVLIIALGPVLSITSTWLFFGSGESVPLTALFQATFITCGLAISPVSSSALVLATALAGLWALFLVMRCGGCLLKIPTEELTSIATPSSASQHREQVECSGCQWL